MSIVRREPLDHPCSGHLPDVGTFQKARLAGLSSLLRQKWGRQSPDYRPRRSPAVHMAGPCSNYQPAPLVACHDGCREMTAGSVPT